MLTTTARASLLLSPLKSYPSNSFKTFRNPPGSVVTGRKSLQVKHLQFHSSFFTKRLSTSHTLANRLKKGSRPIIPTPGISYTRLEVPVSLLPLLGTTMRGVQTENNSLSRKNTEKKIVMGKIYNMDLAVEAIQEFVPPLSQGKHKGQAGKIAVVGGCREYTGAPYFAAFSALKMGADLSHVFCSKEAATVIKSYSPELIVHPVLRESWEALVEGEEKVQLVNQVVAEVGKWLPRFDCIVFGPGLGRDPLLMECVTQVMKDARENNVPIVIDGDALSIVTDKPELVHGYRLAVLTPNLNEHKRLSAKIFNNDTSKKPDNEDLPGQLKSLAASLGNVTIIQKGPVDLISDGNEVLEMDLYGSPRRCGGQGDVLAGCTAVFLAWANTFFKNQPEDSEEKKHVGKILSSNPAMAAAYASSFLVRRSATPAFLKYRRSMTTSELILELGNSMDQLYPTGQYGYRGPNI